MACTWREIGRSGKNHCWSLGGVASVNFHNLFHHLSLLSSNPPRCDRSRNWAACRSTSRPPLAWRRLLLIAAFWCIPPSRQHLRVETSDGSHKLSSSLHWFLCSVCRVSFNYMPSWNEGRGCLLWCFIPVVFRVSVRRLWGGAWCCSFPKALS